jgi:integrase
MLKAPDVERARARAKPYKMRDGHGLYCYVAPTGTKTWRFEFRFPPTAKGARQTLTLGRYSIKGDGVTALTVLQARGELSKARDAIKRGENPAALKQQEKNPPPERTAFKVIAEEWYSDNENGKSASWSDNTRRWLDKRIYPELGKRPIEAISDAEVLSLCRSIQREGKHRTAAYVRRLIAEIYTYALPGRPNPAEAIRQRIKAPEPEHHAKLSERELPAFLKKADAYGDPVIRLALRLLLLTFTRKTELTGAAWSEIDYADAKEWKIPPERMKGGKEHYVPLSRQACECLRELRKFSSNSELVFPSPYKPRKPIGRELLNKAFRKMGYEKFTPHGIRATASTILNERSGFPSSVIDAQLSHDKRDKVEASYNRADYLEQRRRLMQYWADTLDTMRTKGKVLPMRGRAA